MKRSLAAASALAIAACGSPFASSPDNFTCAATLTAYVEAVRDGEIADDGQLFAKSATTVMYHLNAWAIPQDMREPDAFAKVGEEAERIRATTSEEELIETVRYCSENLPGR